MFDLEHPRGDPDGHVRKRGSTDTERSQRPRPRPRMFVQNAWLNYLMVPLRQGKLLEASRRPRGGGAQRRRRRRAVPSPQATGAI